MFPYRTIKKILKSQPTIEGAGVHLKRVFGNAEVPRFDPFLLLDDFHSDRPEDYIAGFPWHPHRGIETVTYMLAGHVEHGDSIGNSGVIQAGDMQWMTAGSGIIHQEMPQGRGGLMWGLQLWVNLPRSHKMMPPRYREIKADGIPQHTLKNGVTVKIISGEFQGHTGPVRDIVCDPQYLDVSVPAGKHFQMEIPRHHTLFAYVLEGQGIFDTESGDKAISEEHLALYNEGESVSITALERNLRFLLISGKPIGEPVAWYGPIVMNTEDELSQAFEEYRNGTFIKD